VQWLAFAENNRHVEEWDLSCFLRWTTSCLELVCNALRKSNHVLYSMSESKYSKIHCLQVVPWSCRWIATSGLQGSPIPSTSWRLPPETSWKNITYVFDFNCLLGFGPSKVCIDLLPIRISTAKLTGLAHVGSFLGAKCADQGTKVSWTAQELLLLLLLLVLAISSGVQSDIGHKESDYELSRTSKLGL
jgi:hypothetical protein